MAGQLLLLPGANIGPLAEATCLGLVEKEGGGGSNTKLGCVSSLYFMVILDSAYLHRRIPFACYVFKQITHPHLSSLISYTCHILVCCILYKC